MTAAPGVLRRGCRHLVLHDRHPLEVIGRRLVEMGVAPRLAVLEPLGRCLYLDVIRTHTPRLFQSVRPGNDPSGLVHGRFVLN